MGNGDLFFSGGQDSDNQDSTRLALRDSYKYIKQENRWDRMTDMATMRSKHACGRVINPRTKKEEVVVAGGSAQSTEIYTVEDNTWRWGPRLPTASLKGSSSLPYQDSFLIVGGHNGSCLDSIFKV